MAHDVPHSQESAHIAEAPAWSGVALAGAMGGLFTALGDYGAVWLWLHGWQDRAWLGLRVLAMWVPAGALIAVAAVYALQSADRAVMWARHFRGRSPTRDELDLPALDSVHRVRGAALGRLIAWALLLALPCRQLAVLLLSGGAMRRLAYHDALEWGLSLVLPLVFAATLWLSERAISAMDARPEYWRTWTLTGVGTGFVLGKLNQWILPNLYDYLHTLLALSSFAASSVGSYLLLRQAPWPGLRNKITRARVQLALGALACLWLVHTVTLGHNLNVRVALFDARCGASRALMSTTDPVLRHLDLFSQRGNGVRARARVSYDTTGLAQHEGAHVLLITIDALRADHLSAYGYKRETSPLLDARGEAGVRFQRAYTQAPHSSYSLTSVMTAEYVHETVHLERPLPEATLASVLAEAGYHTAAFFTDGIFHTEGALLDPYRKSTFHFALYDHTSRDAQATTDRVLQEVDRIVSQGEPSSLLWVHYFDVHEPYRATHFGTRDVDRYDSEIRSVDTQIDRLLREVSERLAGDVVVAITADHGEEFREHGGVYHGSTLYDEQVRVPLWIFAPSLQGRVVQAPVELVDLTPTLLGLVGVSPAPSMRGKDLRPLALGRESQAGAVFSAVTYKRMVVRWPYKLIADLRFNLFQLYDLSVDPDERRNLANAKPALLRDLKAEVYGWLDGLERAPHQAPPHVTPDGDRKWAQALHWGRLGDRRAVQPMCELLLDGRAPTALRLQAATILTRLADPKSADSLAKALRTRPPEVAAEAAIALGRMFDARAREALRKLVRSDDPHLRARAAVSLGRLRDRAAVPALIDTLWVAPSRYEREEAVRWLGRLDDPRAVEPLISLLPEFRLRYLVTVSLGQVGGEAAFDALIDMLDWEHHTNIRDNVIRGLGHLANPRALEPLVHIAGHETGLKNLSESLIRLGALERGRVGGADLRPELAGKRGFGKCKVGPKRHDWNFLNRTYCDTAEPHASFPLRIPAHIAKAPHGSSLLLRMRRTDKASSKAQVRVSLGTEELGVCFADGEWKEHRFELAQHQLRAGPITIHLDGDSPGDTFAIDHVLVVRRRDALAAAPP